MIFKVFGDPHIINNDIIDGSIINFLDKNIEKLDNLILLGDTFSSFDIGSKNKSFYQFLSRLKNEKIYILCGNHDFSRNRNSLKIANYFSDNVRIIEDYEYVDVDNVRLHFLNYFRQSKPEFNLKENSKNILFTHCDMNVKNPPEIFNEFDRIINGHMHDYERLGKYINLGAIRKCAVNEIDDKKYMIFDSITCKFEFKDFKSIIDIKNVFKDELENVIIEKPTVLNVYKSGLDDQKELEKIVKKQEWWSDENIVLNFKPFIDQEIVKTLLNNVSIKEEIDFKKIFKDYMILYEKTFKETISDDIVDIFDEFFNVEFKNINEIFQIYQIKFNDITSKNFKLFKEFKLDFNNYSGITLIEGNNLDEKSEEVSSNESGKSNLRYMIEYSIFGNSANIGNPLRWGEKSGFVELDFIINNDNIKINRKFTNSSNDIIIKINNEDFYPDETPTDKLELFFEKYKFKNALQFIIVSDVGLARYFFSSKNSEKFKIFKDIFPIIEKVSDIVNRLKDVVKEKKNVFENKENEINNIITVRKNQSKYFWNIHNDIMDSRLSSLLKLKELNKEIDNTKIDEDLLKNKEKYEKIYSVLVEKDIIDYKNCWKIYNDNKNIKKILQEHEEQEKIIKMLSVLTTSSNNKKELIENNNVKIEELNKEKNTNVIDDKVYLSDNEYFEIKSLINKKLKIDELKKNYDENILKDLFEYEKMKEKLNSLKMNSDEMKKETIELREKYKELRDKFDIEEKKGIECNKCGNMIKNESMLSMLKNEINETAQKGKNKQNELQLCVQMIESLDKVYQKVDKIRLSYSVNELKEFYFDYENKVKDIKGYTIEKIDDELKELKEKNEKRIKLENIQNRIKELENDNKKLIEENNGLLEDIEKINKEYDNFEFKPEDYDSIIKLFEENNIIKSEYLIMENNIDLILKNEIIDELTDESIDNFYSKYKILKDNILNSEKKDKLEYEIKYIQKSLTDLDNRFNNLINDIKKDNKEYRIKDKKVVLNDLKIDYNKYSSLYKLLTGKRKVNFENYFINYFFEKFENIYNSYMSILFERNVRLKIDALDFYFIDGNNKDIKFNEFSNGAKTKLESNLIFAINTLFRMYGVSSDIFLLDEFLDKGVDKVNLGRLMELIRNFFNDKKNFIISHKDISDYIDDRILIQRENGQSIVC